MTCELRHRSAKKRRSDRLRPVPATPFAPPFRSLGKHAGFNLTSEGVAGQHNAMIAAPYHTAWKLCAKVRRAMVKHRGLRSSTFLGYRATRHIGITLGS